MEAHAAGCLFVLRPLPGVGQPALHGLPTLGGARPSLKARQGERDERAKGRDDEQDHEKFDEREGFAHATTIHSVGQ